MASIVLPDGRVRHDPPGDAPPISTVNSWYLTSTYFEPYMMLQVTADASTANFGNFGNFRGGLGAAATAPGYGFLTAADLALFGALLAVSHKKAKTRLNQAQTDGWLQNAGIPTSELNGGAGFAGAEFDGDGGGENSAGGLEGVLVAARARRMRWRAWLMRRASRAASRSRWRWGSRRGSCRPPSRKAQ